MVSRAGRGGPRATRPRGSAVTARRGRRAARPRTRLADSHWVTAPGSSVGRLGRQHGHHTRRSRARAAGAGQAAGLLGRSADVGLALGPDGPAARPIHMRARRHAGRGLAWKLCRHAGETCPEGGRSVPVTQEPPACAPAPHWHCQSQSHSARLKLESSADSARRKFGPGDGPGPTQTDPARDLDSAGDCRDRVARQLYIISRRSVTRPSRHCHGSQLNKLAPALAVIRRSTIRVTRDRTPESADGSVTVPVGPANTRD